MSNYVFWDWLILSTFFIIVDGILDKRQHQTNGSLEKMNDLMCFQCNTISTGEKCSKLNLHNKTKFHQKCKGDKKKCMVKKYSYTTSTENSTSHLKMWSLERSCTNECRNGCIIIGERTKLHACTACCEENLCNVTDKAILLDYFSIWIRLFFLFILIYMS